MMYKCDYYNTPSEESNRTTDVIITMLSSLGGERRSSCEQSTVNRCIPGWAGNFLPPFFGEGYLPQDDSTTSNTISCKPIEIWEQAISKYLHKDDEIIILATKSIPDTLKEVIGTNGVERLEEFSQFQEGWNFGVGRPLSSFSTGSLSCFLSRYKNFRDEPSVFLSEEGHIVLGWEDGEGYSIELEFSKESIGYYFERDDSEGTLPLNRTSIDFLIEKIEAFR